MTQQDTFGTADNGERASVEFGAYKGLAGIRQRGGGREVAYMAETPRTFPLSGKIKGEDVIAVSLIRSKITGFVVLWVPDAI